VSYYDSQSGLHINYKKGPKVHGILLPMGLTKDPFTQRFSGLQSLTRPAETSLTTPIDATVHSFDEIYVALDSTCQLDILEANENVVIQFQCSGSRDEWDSHIVLCAAATQRGRKVKANLSGAFLLEPAKLELAGCLLADAGVDMIILEDDSGEISDGYDLGDAIEALVNCDVAGLPMHQRVGIRLGATVDSAAEERLAMAEILS